MTHSLALIVEVETTSYDCLTVEKVIDLINNPQDEDDSDYAQHPCNRVWDRTEDQVCLLRGI
ncbi:hypothetical protein M316_0083 [Nitrincola phage 1M3-16]|uniref:hypothetical protein n=1 Tax=Nitrincola phage 1M3-16 TaxID=1472912 RepID=UPI000444BF42|nr:hypothetical protein GJ22_gp069 [Nitrincola phage 1M3-16]AHX01148.1 hypothetical protein M316_0083 [Nitrincola phage 1M3-16]